MSFDCTSLLTHLSLILEAFLCCLPQFLAIPCEKWHLQPFREVIYFLPVTLTHYVFTGKLPMFYCSPQLSIPAWKCQRIKDIKNRETTVMLGTHCLVQPGRLSGKKKTVSTPTSLSDISTVIPIVELLSSDRCSSPHHNMLTFHHACLIKAGC